MMNAELQIMKESKIKDRLFAFKEAGGCLMLKSYNF